jgi:hypothetical protein
MKPKQLDDLVYPFKILIASLVFIHEMLRPSGRGFVIQAIFYTDVRPCGQQQLYNLYISGIRSSM